MASATDPRCAKRPHDARSAAGAKPHRTSGPAAPCYRQQCMRSRLDRNLTRALMTWLLPCCLALYGPSCTSPPDDKSDTAHQLGNRLLAPCCWREPLRDHPSDLADDLRAEIMSRLTAGEASSSIEADLVHRYGERIRALPAGSDPRWVVVALTALLAAAGLFALWQMARSRRWRARAAPPSADVAAAGKASLDETYQLRLEEELAGVD